MNRIGVVGASGRTGRYVVEALQASSTSRLHAALVSPGSRYLGEESGGVLYTSELGILAECDGAVDFSTSAVTLQVAKLCAELKKPLLVGTTGLDSEEMGALERCAQDIPVCVAPNTSLAATALAMAASYLQRVLGPSFDIEVMEIHHRMKRDAPSGTALNVIAGLVGSDRRVVFGREGQRQEHEIGVASLRGGDVPGDHTVFFLGDGERIELTQRAQNRGVFGRGAVTLIERLLNRPPGLYSVQQLLQV